MTENINDLKMYKDVILDIKYLYELYNYNKKQEAELYLDNEVNNKYNLYFDEGQKLKKVKVLSLYR